MFPINHKDAYCQITIRLDSTLTPYFTWRQGLLVQGFLLWLFYGSPGLHQGVCSVFRTGSQEGDMTCVTWMIGLWLQSQFLQLSGPGSGHQSGEVRP